MPARCPDRVPLRSAASAPSPASWPISPAVRAAARPLLAHDVNARPVCSRFRGPTGRPLAGRLRAKAVLEHYQWLKVKCVSISSNYPVSAILIHTWALLAANYSAGAELNN